MFGLLYGSAMAYAHLAYSETFFQEDFLYNINVNSVFDLRQHKKPAEHQIKRGTSFLGEAGADGKTPTVTGVGGSGGSGVSSVTPLSVFE